MAYSNSQDDGRKKRFDQSSERAQQHSEEWRDETVRYHSDDLAARRPFAENRFDGRPQEMPTLNHSFSSPGRGQRKPWKVRRAAPSHLTDHLSERYLTCPYPLCGRKGEGPGYVRTYQLVQSSLKPSFTTIVVPFMVALALGLMVWVVISAAPMVP